MELVLTIVLLGTVNGVCYPMVAHFLTKGKDGSMICLVQTVHVAKTAKAIDDYASEFIVEG